MAGNENQSPEGPRRRIVIPLNQQPSGSQPRRATFGKAVPGSPRKGRARKVLAILGITFVTVVLLLFIGGFFWWRHYQTTPTYALALLVDAAQRNDMATVDKIADMDKIVDNLVGQVTEKAAGRYGVALSSDMRKAIASRAPSLLPAIKRQVRDAVAARIREISAKADQKPFFVVAVAIPYFVHVTTVGGEVADARIAVQDRQVDVQLLRRGDSWKLVAVKDDALVQQMVDNLIKDAPINESEIRQRLGKPPAALRIP